MLNKADVVEMKSDINYLIELLVEVDGKLRDHFELPAFEDVSGE